MREAWRKKTMAYLPECPKRFKAVMLWFRDATHIGFFDERRGVCTRKLSAYLAFSPLVTQSFAGHGCGRAHHSRYVATQVGTSSFCRTSFLIVSVHLQPLGLRVAVDSRTNKTQHGPSRSFLFILFPCKRRPCFAATLGSTFILKAIVIVVLSATMPSNIVAALPVCCLKYSTFG
jgi:hypothetical protein